MSLLANLRDQRFGRLVVLWRAAAKWRCKCDCGSLVDVAAGKLKTGHTQSCGCIRREKFHAVITTHGLYYTPEHAVWNALVQRCTNPNDKDWLDYGGRGITVDPRWLKFENFFADMGPRPSAELTIERVDNTKGYGPGNCRWATWSEQAFNRRPKGLGRKARGL